MPGLASFSKTTVASTLVSPYCASTAASACRATRPVSRLSLRPPHSISTRCVSNICFVSFLVVHCIGSLHRCRRRAPRLSKEAGPHVRLVRGNVSLLPAPDDCPLAANSQTLDDLLVTPLVLAFDVVEETPAEAHHLEQAAPRMIVALV